MKTIFDKLTRDLLIGRINTLDQTSNAKWGKMNVCQMLKHVTLYDQMTQGRIKFKRIFLGRFFGKMALKSLIGDENQIKINLPTFPGLVVEEVNSDIEDQKKQWITLLEAYADFSNPGFTHAFFGNLTREQAGYLAYKHIDHHLRQFNC